MAWRDQMRPATFRSVPFHVESAELTGGRRTVKHEYPHRDEPFVEDLGLRGRSFSVDGYVLGTDYLAARDRLILALETSGPGELVHPYHGTRRVACSSFRVRETAAEGGMARFSIEFDETPVAAPAPSSSPNAAAAIEAANALSLSSVSDEFVVTYDVEDQPGWTLESLAATVTSAAEALEEQLKPVVSSAQALAELQLQLRDLRSRAMALVLAPAELVETFTGILGSLTADVLAPRRGLDALVSAYAFTPTVARPETPTSTRLREQQNYDALNAFIRRVILAQAASLLPEEEFESYQDATSTRGAVTDLLESELEAAGDDAYPALHQLHAELIRGVPGDDSGLPRLLSHTPPATVPSLVLAYQLYGDLELEQDLVLRNGIQHPGFIRGGQPLEVLSRG